MVMLSPKLLELLRVYWKWRKPKDWLFPGDHPLFQNAVRVACQKLRKKLGIAKPLSPHVLRHYLHISEATLHATASPLDDLPIRIVRTAQGGNRTA
jgi:integrase